jgi:prepilin-type N-terminal cleavage/methylation domain-containing protein/prepilin-type processing-associated H-X9-DG protein
MGANAMALGWRMGDAMRSAGTARTTRRRHIGSGFTLMEVLVVTTIIALLIGLLIPGLGRARDMARRAKCMTNLRAMGGAMAMYASDNKTYIPRDYHFGSNNPSSAPGGSSPASNEWGHVFFSAAFASYLSGPDLNPFGQLDLQANQPSASMDLIRGCAAVGVYQCPALHNTAYPLNYVANGIDFDNFRATGQYLEPGSTYPAPKGSPACKMASIPGPLSEVAYIMEGNIPPVGMSATAAFWGGYLSASDYNYYDMNGPQEMTFTGSQANGVITAIPPIAPRMIASNNAPHFGSTTLLFFDGHVAAVTVNPQNLPVQLFNPLDTTPYQ